MYSGEGLAREVGGGSGADLNLVFGKDVMGSQQGCFPPATAASASNTFVLSHGQLRNYCLKIPWFTIDFYCR